MIPQKVLDHIDEYISQEIYVQVSIIKGKEKISIDSAIERYFDTNHFKDLLVGKPYYYFINGIKDKCLIKLKNSPMRNKKTDDKIIKLLQKKLNDLSNEELNNTYWEIETGEFFSGEQLRELEEKSTELTKKLSIEKNNTNHIKKLLLEFCKKYETICKKKYPEAPLPLGILKSN